jgi:transcriptional regulator with XRE-family HTH domain
MIATAGRCSGGRAMPGARRVTTRDKDIGQHVRMRRLEKSMSQTVMGNHLGITFQQVQKYENGTNRISASRLQRVAEVLEVPIAFFFEIAETALGDKPLAYLQTEGSMRLVRAFAEITNGQARYALVEIAEHLARGSKIDKQ